LLLRSIWVFICTLRTESCQLITVCVFVRPSLLHLRVLTVHFLCPHVFKIFACLGLHFSYVVNVYQMPLGFQSQRLSLHKLLFCTAYLKCVNVRDAPAHTMMKDRSTSVHLNTITLTQKNNVILLFVISNRYNKFKRKLYVPVDKTERYVSHNKWLNLCAVFLRSDSIRSTSASPAVSWARHVWRIYLHAYKIVLDWAKFLLKQSLCDLLIWRLSLYVCACDSPVLYGSVADRNVERATASDFMQ
jgi:hypothetical protein